MASEVTTEVTGEDLADASTDAHADDGAADTTEVARVPAAIAAAFTRGSGGTPKVDPSIVAEVVAALTAPGCDPFIVLPGHPAEDGTGGFNLRAAVAAAIGVAPQWFTVREREVEGQWYWQITYREAPTKDRSKVRAVAVAPADDAGADAGEDESPAEA